MFTLSYLPPRDDFWDNTHFRSLQGGHSDSHQGSGHGHGIIHGTNNTAFGGHGLGPGGGGGNPAQFGNPSQMGPHHSHAHPSTLLHGAPLQPHPVRPTANTHYLAYHQYLLQQVMRDEVAIEHRKNNVRRFGAHWIRPPGVAKTLQARLEEEAEKRDAAEQARREHAMQELVQAQEEAAARAAAQAAEEQEVDGEMERDLDAEVPEAEEEEEDDEEDELEDDEDDEEDEDQDDEDEPVIVTSRNANRLSTFNNEDSLLHGSFVGGDEELAPGSTQHFLEAEDAELDGRAQDMRDFGLAERDLDDDIPEAGSYEHTDTEAEDSSDMDDDDEEEQSLREEITEEMNLESSFHSVTRRRSRRGGRHSGGQEISQPALRSSFGSRDEPNRAEASPRDSSWLMRRLRGARRGRT